MLTKQKILISSLVLALAISGAIVYLALRSSSSQDIKKDTTQNINYDPPTEEEKQQAEDNKERIIEEENNNKDPEADDDGRVIVAPIISSAAIVGSDVEVRSYVTGTIENGGTCQATLTQNGNTVSKESTSVADATTTICPPLRIPLSQLSSGTWSIVVTYSSLTSTGTSNSASVEIP